MAPGKLALAAAAGNILQVERLLLQEGVDVDERDEDGLTPMMAAAAAGQLKVVQRLLELKSPSLSAVDPTGRTALDHAVEAEQEEVVNYMTLDLTLLPFSRGLLPAVVRGDLEVVKEILSATDERLKSSVNIRDQRSAPLLHCAVKAGHEALIAELLRHPELDLQAQDRYGRTALDAAEDQAKEEIAFLLRAKGCRPSAEIDIEG